MTTHQLARQLRIAYNTAPKKYKTANMCLFGIQYADELKANLPVAEVLRRSRIDKCFTAEINVGMKLAARVTLK